MTMTLSKAVTVWKVAGIVAKHDRTSRSKALLRYAGLNWFPKTTQAIKHLKRKYYHFMYTVQDSKPYRETQRTWFKLKPKFSSFFGLIQHVNVYTVERVFGGHEEGGWYFNWYTLIDFEVCLKRNSEAVQQKLFEKHKHRIEGNIYSVLGGTDVVVRIEDMFGESQTKYAETYE